MLVCMYSPGDLLTRATRLSVDCPVLLNSSSSFTLPHIGFPVFGSNAGTRIAIFRAATSDTTRTDKLKTVHQ
eukprot:COSAG06_NODE_1250_length_10106_cov_413.553113_10_plen_72_part_00